MFCLPTIEKHYFFRFIGNTTSGGSGNRYPFQFGNGSTSGIGAGLSSFMRSTSAGLESMLSGANSLDPIAELLSQLTGVRRAAASSHSTNLQLQQLQAQLNREREHLQSQTVASLASGGGGASRHHHHHSLGHHLFSNSSSNKLNPFNSIKNLANAHGTHGSVSATQASNAAAAAASQTASNLTNAMTNEILELQQNLFLQPLSNNSRDPRYLLSKFDLLLLLLTHF